MEYDKSKNFSGDAIEWNRNFNENDNNFWENISEENIINDNDEYNIYESIIIKMKRFTYLSMDLVLTPLQKKCYIDYYKYENGDKVEMIANELGISCATVYKHVRIARGKLFILSEIFIEALNYQSKYEITINKLKQYIKYLDNEEEIYIITNYFIYNKKLQDIKEHLGYSKYQMKYMYKKTRQRIITRTSITTEDLTDLLKYNKNKKYCYNLKHITWGE